MTEDQAKTKWCPMVRFHSDGTPTRGGTTIYPDKVNCITSDCMMWAWDEAFNCRDATGKGYGGTNCDTEGHCGLINP